MSSGLPVVEYKSERFVVLMAVVIPFVVFGGVVAVAGLPAAAVLCCLVAWLGWQIGTQRVRMDAAKVELVQVFSVVMIERSTVARVTRQQRGVELEGSAEDGAGWYVVMPRYFDSPAMRRDATELLAAEAAERTQSGTGTRGSPIRSLRVPTWASSGFFVGLMLVYVLGAAQAARAFG